MLLIIKEIRKIYRGNVVDTHLKPVSPNLISDTWCAIVKITNKLEKRLHVLNSKLRYYRTKKLPVKKIVPYV